MKYRAAALMILAGSCAAPPPDPVHSGPPAELAGRIAGPPRECVQMQQSEPLRVAEGDRHMLIYGRGRTIWVNHLGPDCSIREYDTLVTHSFGSSYCHGDIVRSFEPSSLIPGPACILGPFIPYTR